MIAEAEIAALRGYVDIVALAESLGADPPKREGRRFRTRCLWHSERTGSLVLWPDQGKYYCFGCPEHGDVFKLVARRLDVDFLGAVRYLARFSGYWPEGLTDDAGQVQPKVVPPAPPPPRVKEDKRLRWATVLPIPDRVPDPSVGTFEIFLHSAGKVVRPSLFWVYRSPAGRLGCDVRYEYEIHPKDNRFRVGDRVLHGTDRGEVAELLDGGLLRLVDGRRVDAADTLLCTKDVITWTWCEHLEDHHQEWRMRAWDEPAPLYGLDQLAARPDEDVLICEGCKAAEAGGFRTGMVAVTWRGGCRTAEVFDRVDWSPLSGRRCVIWPDADELGRRAAWHIAQHLVRVQAASVRVVYTADLPKGWDLADD